MSVLDIGCGKALRGDVNIDINKSFRQGINNFIVADANHLPFKDDCFSLAIASHVIEHMRAPYETLKEWKRVSKRLIVFAPSAFDLDRTKDHYYTWNPQTLKALLSQVFDNVNVTYTNAPTRLCGRKIAPLLNVVFAKLGFKREIKATCCSF